MRLRMVLGVLAAIVVLRRCTHDSPPPAPRSLHAAVLADGFAILEDAGGDRHVLGYADDGQRHFRRAVPVRAPGVQLAGTRVGPAVSWLDNGKLKLAAVRGDGELGDTSSWGKAVRFQCDGVATNEHRYAFGWTDKDNRVWMVHGPVSRTRDDEAPVVSEVDTQGTISWCGVASAYEDVALLWRDGGATYANFCSTRSCSGIVRKLPVPERAQLLGFGCAKDNCVIAMRDGDVTKLAWLGPTGRPTWVETLTDAVPGAPFSIVGAGDRAIAVGYLTTAGAVAMRTVAAGGLTRVWHDPAAHDVPSLAWARGTLFVAHRHGDTIAPEVVPLPR